MKKLIIFFSLFIMATASCSHEDIWNELQEHEDRIAELERLCSQMNTNISSLQTALTALQDNDYVTSVTPVKAEGQIIGYTISFSKSGDITIYHGADGSDGEDGTDGVDGYSPRIGVQADEDGVYYWTLDGEWLLDDEGNRIKASSADGADGSDGQDGVDGTDGKDGMTPQLKIESGLWYVSYDAGKTWILAGKATGDNGKDGNMVFSDIAVSDDAVTLTLADGVTEIILPRQMTVFDVAFDGGDCVKCGAGETVTIPYSLTYGSDDVQIKVFPGSGLEVRMEKTDAVSGNVMVTAPDPFMEDVEVTLLISDGAEKTIMRTISLSLEYDESYVIRYQSNTDAKIDVSMPAMLSNTYIDGVGEIVLGTPVRTVTGFADRIDLKSVTLPETASSIGNAAFKGCTGLYKMIIPDSVTSIEDYAFAGCDRLMEISFGSGLTRIGSNAFEGCTGFDSFEVPDHVTSIGAYVFKDCSDDMELTISYGLLMKNPLNKVGRIILMEGVAEIAANAFQNCADLTSVTLPESVVSIGSYAFSGCTSLTDIKIGESIETIGVAAFASTPLTSFVMPTAVTVVNNDTFYGCSRLESIDLGAVTEIGDSAFEDCIKLASVVIPDSVRKIGARTFKGTWISEVTFGTGLEYIGADAFSGLFIKAITLPDSLLELGEYAFGSCALLESVALGCGIETIGDMAFCYNGSLTSLTIPASVRHIGQDVFTGCSRFVSLYCEALTPPVMNSILSSDTQIYVPSSCVEAYKAASGWADHAEQINGI